MKHNYVTAAQKKPGLDPVKIIKSMAEVKTKSEVWEFKFLLYSNVYQKMVGICRLYKTFFNTYSDMENAPDYTWNGYLDVNDDNVKSTTLVSIGHFSRLSVPQSWRERSIDRIFKCKLENI